MSDIKPVVKWAGGKRQLLDLIEPLVPEYDRYFEPFLGGGAVLFKLLPENARINDLNADLCIMYRVVRDCPDELIELLDIHKENLLKSGADYYYSIRNIDRLDNYNRLSNVEKAARLIFLNKTCYNGLYRVNLKEEFNVPYGKRTNPSLYDIESIYSMSDYLDEKNVILSNTSFELAVKDAKNGDFVYFDPPYDLLKKDSFTSYQKDGFGEESQIKLKKIVDLLTDKGVKCLVSNSCTDFIRNLYGDKYNIKIINAARAINSKGNLRGKVPEVLIMNW